jgi:hypothetical protein
VFKETPYWGAYMTDVIKDFEQLISSKVTRYLRENMDFEKENIKILKEEIAFIGAKNPKLIAFGVDVFKVLNRNLSNQYTIIKVPHYSNYTSKEKYREEIKCLLNI